MALELSLTDGTTTVQLADGTTAEPLEYTPATPDVQRRMVGQATRDGEEQAAASQKNVAETARVLLLGGTTTIRTNLAAINRLFRQAERYQKKHLGAPVYVQLKPNGDAAAYRSEGLSGGGGLGGGARG